MQSLAQTLTLHLPDWAQPANPVLRHMICRRKRRWPGTWRWLERAGVVFSMAALALIGWLAHDTPLPLGADPCDSALFTALYLPLLVLQWFAVLLALLWGATALGAEQQRGRWDAFRVTSHGAEKLVRARWVALFYRLRALLILLTVPRVLLIGSVIVASTDYQGRALNLYAMGTPSPLPLSVSVIMLAALLTAAMALTPVLMGLNAAIGLLIAVTVRGRTLAGLVRGTVLVAEVGLLGVALHVLRCVLSALPTSSATGQATACWAQLLLVETLGDQGLRLLDAQTFLQTWTDMPCGALLGGALLGSVVLLLLATRGTLTLAARRAARPFAE